MIEAGLSHAVIVSLGAWIALGVFRGAFWRADQRLPDTGELSEPDAWPSVSVVIPARNEPETIGGAVRSLLENGYLGDIRIVLVDDGSTDGTADAAAAAGDRRLRVVVGEPLPDGWSGKLWAVHRGLAEVAPETAFVLFGDADIEHAPGTLARLVTKAVAERLDLVSVMALLEARSFWERLLIPAFVFFFQKL